MATVRLNWGKVVVHTPTKDVCGRLTVAIGLIAVALSSFPTATAADGNSISRCTNLISLKFSVSEITHADVVRDKFTTPGGRTLDSLPAFCRLVIHSSFSSDSSVNSELWLPLSGWNERFLGTGNGGMAGAIAYTSGGAAIPDPDGAMAMGLKRGFAVANTDLGMSRAPNEPFPAIGHPIKWLDYGHRATHEMTVVSKDIIRVFYGESPKYSYFAGCSTGGFQSMRSVQSFPEDYDGFLTGHIGPNRSAKLIAIQYNYMLPKLYPEGRLSNDKLMLMHKSVLAQCAGLGGGSKSDPFLSAPYDCKWKPETLLCETADADQCLTQPQIDMANRLYFGLQNPRTKEMVWPGLPRGTELGWEAYMAAADENEPPLAEATRSILGAQHDFWKSDWDRDVETYIQIMSPFWNTTETDLTPFEQTGGKILMYFGYNDTSTSYDTTNYYEAVRAGIQARGGLSTGTALTQAQAQAKLQEYYRLFMIPGMEHCGGGNGPNSFDGLSVLIRWVEQDAAPDSIVATWEPTPGHFPASLGVPMSRALCPYPAVSQYKGSGDKSTAENFVCE